jgi:hypothetical protein
MRSSSSPSSGWKVGPAGTSRDGSRLEPCGPSRRRPLSLRLVCLTVSLNAQRFLIIEHDEDRGSA